MEKFTGKTKGELVDFLRRAKGKNGKPFDVDTFDRRSVKSLDELFAETQEREIELGIVDGLVWRLAWTIKLLIFTLDLMWVLEEDHRVVNGKPVYKHNRASGSETQKHNERSDPERTVIRCLDEEYDLRGGWEFIRRITPEGNWFNPQHQSKPEEYESTAYADVITSAYVEWFAVGFKERPWVQEMRSFFDKATKSTELIVVWKNQVAPFADQIRRLEEVCEKRCA